MKAQLSAFAAIVIIAIGANIILGQLGFSSSEMSAGINVRLSAVAE
jgi:hypothetical protein